MEYFSKLLRGGVLLQIGINTDAMGPVLEKNKEQKLINIQDPKEISKIFTTIFSQLPKDVILFLKKAWEERVYKNQYPSAELVLTRFMEGLTKTPLEFLDTISTEKDWSVENYYLLAHNWREFILKFSPHNEKELLIQIHIRKLVMKLMQLSISKILHSGGDIFLPSQKSNMIHIYLRNIIQDALDISQIYKCNPYPYLLSQEKSQKYNQIATLIKGYLSYHSSKNTHVHQDNQKSLGK